MLGIYNRLELLEACLGFVLRSVTGSLWAWTRY